MQVVEAIMEVADGPVEILARGAVARLHGQLGLEVLAVLPKLVDRRLLSSQDLRGPGAKERGGA